jgi:hypothetical protein
MKSIDREITQYWIHLQSGTHEPNRVYPPVLIKCYDEEEFVLQLTFHPDNRPLPENHYDNRNKLVFLRYPMSMYYNIIDTLRNEKPIYFRFAKDLNQGFIRTGKEPVGEGELEAVH